MGISRYVFNHFFHLITIDFVLFKSIFPRETFFITTLSAPTSSLSTRNTEESSKVDQVGTTSARFKKEDSGFGASIKTFNVSFMKKLDPNDKNNEKNKHTENQESPLTDYFKKTLDHHPFDHDVQISDEEYEAMRKKFKQWKKKMDAD